MTPFSDSTTTRTICAKACHELSVSLSVVTHSETHCVPQWHTRNDLTIMSVRPQDMTARSLKVVTDQLAKQQTNAGRPISQSKLIQNLVHKTFSRPSCVQPVKLYTTPKEVLIHFRILRS